MRGAWIVLARFAPWAVLLQQNHNPTPNRRSTRPGCEGGLHGAKICVCPVRTVGGAPTTKPNPTPDRRSTRPGCEWGHAWGVDCARPVRTEAVLLQQNHNPTPTRRSTRPGCEGGLHGAWIVPDPFAPGRCSYNKTNPTPNRWSTRPGCEGGAPCTKEA